MACNFPVYTYRTDGSITQRPCSQCMGCRIDKSKDWAVRCVHESSLHAENCFITLTFNNENLPKNGSIDKQHVSGFMKKLRKSIYPKKVRFFGCGEYGETKNRPHYHICLFGYNFQDREIFVEDTKKFKNSRNRKGQDHTIYISEELSDLWKYGFHTIGDLSYESAAYVARYVTKKIMGTSPEARELYAKKYNGREPEFALMSRMPGIGKEWVQKYHSDVYPKDFVTIKGVKFKPPRYYDSVYASMFPGRFMDIKEKRRENHVLSDLPADEACSHEDFKYSMLERNKRGF